MKTLFLIGLFIYSTPLCAKMNTLPPHLSPLVLKVAVITEFISPWSDQEITAMFVKTNKILAQCSIYIDKEQTLKIIPLGLPLGYESVPAANTFYQQLEVPVVLLVSRTQENGSAGFSPGSKFLFVSHYSRSQDYIEKHHPSYETLAHELGHMMGNLRHVGAESNLMSAYIDNQSDLLTDKQCAQMRKHNQLEPLSK
ncbi:MAG: hypothetical protein IT287_05980 [Bdellovibrionaceae bacterium]|nr:hypothetical protein [Pseudobdellovibrionaceae bacterium]